LNSFIDFDQSRPRVFEETGWNFLFAPATRQG